MPEGNWIALKGLISGKPPFVHHNQSPSSDAYLYSSKYISHGFPLFMFSASTVLCWWHPGLCDSRQKWLTALSNTLLGGVSCFQGGWVSKGSLRKVFLEINAASHFYSYKHSLPWELPSTPTNSTFSSIAWCHFWGTEFIQSWLVSKGRCFFTSFCQCFYSPSVNISNNKMHIF